MGSSTFNVVLLFGSAENRLKKCSLVLVRVFCGVFGPIVHDIQFITSVTESYSTTRSCNSLRGSYENRRRRGVVGAFPKETGDFGVCFATWGPTSRLCIRSPRGAF